MEIFIIYRVQGKYIHGKYLTKYLPTKLFLTKTFFFVLERKKSRKKSECTDNFGPGKLYNFQVKS